MEETGWGGEFDPLADPEERRLILSVLDSFRSYRRLCHYNGTHVRRQAFYSLPQEHWALLSKPPFSVLDSLSRLDDLIDANAELAESIFKAGFQAFVAPTLDSEWVASIVPEKHAHDEYQIYSTVMDHLGVRASQHDLDKARSCVHQFYRDWSAEGLAEREKCFAPIIHALDREYTIRSEASTINDRSELNVLVPGAGLGRLLFDICRAGYTVEGNEISYHELIGSTLALNQMEKDKHFTIAPWALNTSNHLTRADQFRTCQIPDIHPATTLAEAAHNSTIPPQERMSMASGDFCVLYTQPDSAASFDTVATVFFIDTAPNIIRYIETVRNCLKPGGIWVNLGPLLWHHASRRKDLNDNEEKKEFKDSERDAGIGEPGSVELTDEEVVALVEHHGFAIEEHQNGHIETGYISNASSMLQSTYRPSFWVARKK